MLKEVTGDLFNAQAGFEAICIPTNGIVKDNGELVMGAGVARIANLKFVGICRVFGRKVLFKGNHVHLGTIGQDGHGIVEGVAGMHNLKYQVLSFPTKHNWKDPASLSLIVRSAEELSHFVLAYHWNKVALPRVGCGLGGLSWESVSPLLSKVFEKHDVLDRIVIVNKEQ